MVFPNPIDNLFWITILYTGGSHMRLIDTTDTRYHAGIRPKTSVMTRYTPTSASGLQDT